MPSIKIKELKNIISKLATGVEKNEANPSAQYLEMIMNDNNLTVNVSNTDYYLSANMPIVCEDNLHAVIMADNFINIISKLDVEDADISVENNALIVQTKKNKYTFPIIKYNGEIYEIATIETDENDYAEVITNTFDGSDIATVSESNAQGLVDATFTKQIQQFIYVDNSGALTFTDNIYVNDFKNAANNEFAILLNAPQARLLKIFDGLKNMTVKIFMPNSDTDNICAKFIANNITLTFITQPKAKVDTFPAEKIRNLSVGDSNHHAVINKGKLDKALSRLMVFDKKIDISILNSSKLVFSKDSIKLISVKNHNYEIVDYDKANDATEDYEAIIRFSDLVNQLKAVLTNTVDISYGNGKAIVINSAIKQIIPEIKERAK